MDSFPERLKTIIQQRGIKQIDLAAMIGVPRGAISNYLKGRYKPNGETLAQMAKVLNVSPSWLAGFDEDQNDQKIMMDIAEAMKGLDRKQMVLLLAFIKSMRGTDES